MEPMVRPARPPSWNRRNCLMNRQGTVWNRPEPEPERSNQVPNGTGTGWNRNGTGPTRTVAITTCMHLLFLPKL